MTQRRRNRKLRCLQSNGSGCGNPKHPGHDHRESSIGRQGLKAFHTSTKRSALGKRKRRENSGVHDAEDGGVGADAESQCKDEGDEKPGLTEESAKAVAHIGD